MFTRQFAIAEVQTCQLLCCWTLGKLLQRAVSKSVPSFALVVIFTTSCTSHIYQLLVWPYFALPQSRNAFLIHRGDVCNRNLLAFLGGVSEVNLLIGRIVGLRISAGNDLMFSSFPCARNVPCSSDAGISFLSTVSALIVHWLHLNNQSADSLNSSGEMTFFLFLFQPCVVGES